MFFPSAGLGCLVLLLMLAVPVRAQPTAAVETAAPEERPASWQDDWTLSLYLENDLFTRTDQDYTHGTKLTWLSPNLHDTFNDTRRIPGWLKPIVQRLPFVNNPGVQKNLSFSFGQNIYTPSDISVRELIPNDRPYAGWLYLGVAFHNRTERWSDTLELSLGVVGPWALGGETQNAVHRLRNFDEAQGWEHQIKNEPALNLIWERKVRLARWGDYDGFGADLIGHGGSALGNVYIYGNGGGTARFGWNLPEDYGSALIRFAGSTNGPAGPNDIRTRSDVFPFGLHAFLTVDGRLMLRDITLDGNTFRSSHSVEREWMVGDVSVGAAMILDRWKLSYAVTHRTRTFEKGDAHEFGSINLSLTY